MEQRLCDLELRTSRELDGLKDAEQAVSEELDLMQWTPDTEEQGQCFGIELSAPQFTPFLSLPSEIPRMTVSGLPSMQRWASPALSSWASRSKSGSLSGLLLWVLLCGEGRHVWQVLTYLVWPHVSGGVAMYCLGLSSNTERTGWTEIWWKGWIANRWKLFTALYFSFGLLWHGLMTLIFTPLADKLCAIQNIAAKNPLYWHWLEGCFPLKASNC